MGFACNVYIILAFTLLPCNAMLLRGNDPAEPGDENRPDGQRTPYQPMPVMLGAEKPESDKTLPVVNVKYRYPASSHEPSGVDALHEAEVAQAFHKRALRLQDELAKEFDTFIRATQKSNEAIGLLATALNAQHARLANRILAK